MEHEAVLLRYHEIALKGANRSWFENRLAQNARKIVSRALPVGTQIEVERENGRVILHTRMEPSVKEALGRVFGISSYSPMKAVSTNLEVIASAALEGFREYCRTRGNPASFRVLTRRSDKALPETSMEIDRFIGTKIHQEFPQIQVKMKDHDLTVGVEIHHKQSYLWLEKIPGPGGLPVATNGQLLALLSGGLDSPVAAIQLLRRGASCSFIHFYGAPFVGPEALEKVEDLVRIVNRFQPTEQPLYVVPFGKIQEKVALSTSPKVRTVLYRRLMVRIANEMAAKLDAQALITGESLGQVASQTLENLTNIDEVSSKTILRPLVGFDKEDIIRSARLWGTYETAIRPAADCCTLFADRHPVIRSTRERLEEEEAKISIPQLVEEALSGTERRFV